MRPADIAVITKVMGPVMRDFTAKAVAEATAPLVARNAALEQRILELETRPEVAGPQGPMGEKGETGTGVSSLVVSADGRLMAHLTDGRSFDAGPLPRGEKGSRGEQGERGDVGPIGLTGPMGERGERGERGEPGQSVTGPRGERGERGQDAPAPDLDAIVTRVLALVPPPIRGEKGEQGERGPKGEGIVGPMGPQGERGFDGKSVDMDAVTEQIDARLTKAIEAIPIPRDGRDGKDGRDIDPAALEMVVSAHVEKAIASIPAPKDGQDGAPGADGQTVTVDDVMPLITREIELRIAAIPVAKDGVGFTGAVVNREGHLVLTLSNGTTQDIGPVVGKDGAPGLDGKDAVGTPGKDGKDGLDGLGFDDYDLVLDDTRGWLFRLGQGERVKEWELGIPFDAKVWTAGTVYPKGAGTTWDGHYWIALQKTSEQPGEANPAWRLAVRRGKQGREGKEGKAGAPGKDLTQMDPATGRKW